jgi:hypothetical protein
VPWKTEKKKWENYIKMDLGEEAVKMKMNTVFSDLAL